MWEIQNKHYEKYKGGRLSEKMRTVWFCLAKAVLSEKAQKARFIGKTSYRR